MLDLVYINDPYSSSYLKFQANCREGMLVFGDDNKILKISPKKPESLLKALRNTLETERSGGNNCYFEFQIGDPIFTGTVIYSPYSSCPFSINVEGGGFTLKIASAFSLPRPWL